MDEKYTELAVQLKGVESRSKTNEHRINECEDSIKNLRDEQKAISVIAASIDKMATSMLDMKEDIKEMKWGQTQLTDKVTVLENRPAQESWEDLKFYKKELYKYLLIGLAGTILGFVLISPY